MNLSGLANIIGNSIVGGVPGGGGGTPPQPANAWSMQTDGTNQYAQSVTTPYSTLDGDSKWSISMWLKPDNVTHHRILFYISRDTTAQNSQCFAFLRAGGILQFSIQQGNFYKQTSVPLTAGVWQHVAITVDLTTGVSYTYVDMYINGVLSNGTDTMSSTFGITSAPTSTSRIAIGEDAVSGYQPPYYGHIDEFAIWSGIKLSSSDVLGIYNQGGAGKPGNLNQLTNPPNLWYRFGDNNTPPGSGTAIPNEGSSGATDNGVAINGASFVNDTP